MTAPTADAGFSQTIDPEQIVPDARSLEVVTAAMAVHYRICPVGWDNEILKIAMARPVDMETVDELGYLLKRRIKVFQTAEDAVLRAIDKNYGMGADTAEKMEAPFNQPVPMEAAVNDLTQVRDASVIQLVNRFLLEAYAKRATDIHLEPYADGLRVRCRIDGILYDMKTAASLQRFQTAILSRVKIMAELSIAEKRLPQDGRIKALIHGQEMDMRVSTLPTGFGESMVIRLLTSRDHLTLPRLGFGNEDLETLESYVSMPHGILLLTGPTGSGKTTSLYAFLRKINGEEKKIITLEDPVEYQIQGITQVQVQPKIGLTFAQGLRSMLRHDPDVMMVGEIRDLETAEIAIRVALTGHLVFSTLHTNDAAGAVTRLLDLGLEPFLVASSVLGIVAQRLVRVLCPACKRPAGVSRETAEAFRVTVEDADAVYAARGCAQCRFTGFSGRTVIYEILPLTKEMRALVMRRSSADVLRARAIAQGMRTLRRCGWEKIRQGATTCDEVLRATLQEQTA